MADVHSYKSHLRVAFFCLVFGWPTLNFAQEATSQPGAYQDGESISFTLAYQWGLLWMPAGEVTFSVQDTVFNDTHTGHIFTGYGQSLKAWDWFYKVRSTYRSVCDSTALPLTFERFGREGSNQYNRSYTIHNPDSARIFKQESDSLESWRMDLNGRPCRDVISAIYYFRTIDYSSMAVGDSIPLKLVLDGEVFETHVLYSGETLWKDKRTGKKYMCHLIEPHLIPGTVFKPGNGMRVYISTDKRQLPLYVETDLLVGKAKVHLSDVQGLVPLN